MKNKLEEERMNSGGAQVNLFGQESKVRNMVWEIVNPIKAMIKNVQTETRNEKTKTEKVMRDITELQVIIKQSNGYDR
jgi:hypothetical protein